MTDFRERYKRVGFGREDVDVNRVLRSQRRDEARHEQRSEHFSLRRDLGTSALKDDRDSFLEPEPATAQSKKLDQSSKDSKRKTAEDVEVAVQQRLLELEKWQKERNRKKIAEKKRIKPAFKVGVVHHKIYSPPLNKESTPVPHQKLCKTKESKQEQQQPPKRVTRATEKRLAAKAVTNQQKREDVRNKLKAPASKDEPSKAPFAPTNYQFRPPVGVTPLPMFGRLASEDVKENVICNTASANVSSTSTVDFGRNFSQLSDSVFVSNSMSLNSSKVAGRRSNLRRSNVRPCDSTTNKSLHNLSSNSSVEEINLKLSSDDPEMLNDSENVEFSKINLSLPKHMKSPARKRKSSNRSVSKPPVDEPVLQGQEMMDVQETSDDKNNTTISTTTNRRVLRGHRRSTKIVLNESSVEAKDASFVLEDQEKLDSNAKNDSFTVSTSFADKSVSENFNNEVIEKSVVENSKTLQVQNLMNNIEIIDSKLKTTVLDSPKPTVRRSVRNLKSNSEQVANEGKLNASAKDSSLAKLNKSKSLATRKSAISTKSRPEEESVETPMDQDDVKNDNVVDSTVSRQTRNSAAIRRKSAKVSNDENVPINGVEMTMGRESVFDLQNKHLLDITLSDLNKFKSPKQRKTTKINEASMDFEDQSLIKFSPRQSLRLQNDKLKQPEVTSTTKTPDESFAKFDPLAAKSNEKLNVSTSSEPTRQKSPNSQNDSQNFSLNLSLSDESPSERPPVFYSPYIVTSRGKSNVRKEVQKRRFSHRIEEDVPTKDTVMQSLNISVEEEERTAQYYKYILDKEIERLNERCSTWNAIKEAESTPEDILYLIQAAVGHTQLLINKKFQRFRGLVLDCESGKGEMLVTCKDLQGFWEMMYMEIKDVDNRFNKLEELKAKDWVPEPEETKEEEKPKKKAPAKKPAAKKKPTAKASSIRAHIMAARKKMENKGGEMDVDVREPAESKSQEKSETEKQGVAGTPKDARRSSSTPKNLRRSLVNKLQTSSGRKSVPSSPLIAMKISLMCKTPEVHLDDSIVYINSNQTPAKSILKAKPKDDVNGSIVKSKNKVFFKEQPMEVQEFASNMNDYGGSSDKEPVERRLDFENDSFDASNVENQETAEEVELRHELFLNKDGVICERFVPVTPKVAKLKRSESERVTRSTRKNKVDESKVKNATPNTPRSQRRTTQKSETVSEDSPFPSAELLNNKKELLTPSSRKSLKRVLDTSDSSESTPTGDEPVSKVRKTPKSMKALNSTNVNDGAEKKTPRLKRSKSLHTPSGKKNESENSVKTPRSNLQRSNSQRSNSRLTADSKEELDKTLTPGVRRRSLKVT